MSIDKYIKFKDNWVALYIAHYGHEHTPGARRYWHPIYYFHFAFRIVGHSKHWSKFKTIPWMR